MATSSGAGRSAFSGDEYRRARAARLSMLASYIAVVSSVAMLLALPDWLESGSPLAWIAMTIALPLLCYPTFYVFGAISCGALRAVIGRQLDKTYSSIEIVAAFMPLRAAENYRSEMATNARRLGDAQFVRWRGKRLSGDKAKHQAFRWDIWASSAATIAEGWRSRGAHRLRRGPGPGAAVGWLAGVLVLGVALTALTGFLLAQDHGADVADILSLQMSIISSVLSLYGLIRSRL